MNQEFLIPANSKRSMLIFGLFNKIDLIIFSTGALITLALMFTIKTNNLKDMFMILSPLLVSSVMVLPVPNHRNIWQLTANIYNFFSKRRSYYWRGWCVLDENIEEKQ